jgi:metal-responsive CopG/Arc/MetJ family transcriptional regulator
MRVNMNIPDELLSQIDAKAKALYVNRTAWIVMALAQKLREEGLVDKMPDMVDIMKKITLDEMQEQNADCIERPQARDNDSSS